MFQNFKQDIEDSFYQTMFITLSGRRSTAYCFVIKETLRGCFKVLLLLLLFDLYDYNFLMAKLIIRSTFYFVSVNIPEPSGDMFVSTLVELFH